jgi:hypothetical protein
MEGLYVSGILGMGDGFSASASRGGSIYETMDGGLTWSYQPVGLNVITDIAYAPDGSRFLVGSAGSILAGSSGLPPQGVPLLLFPGDDTVLVEQSVDLSWEPLPFVFTYQVQVAIDSDFVDLVTTSLSVETEFTFLPPENGSFFWRVSALNSAGNGPWSEVRRFVVSAPLPTVLTLLSPPAGQVLQLHQVQILWRSGVGANSYSIMISEDQYFSTALVDQAGIADTFYVFDAPANNTYYWRARGRNIAGEGPWSETFSFTVASPLPSPVALFSPQDSAVVLATSLRLTWLQLSDEISRYWFELSTDQTFSPAFVDSMLADTAIVVTTIELGREYWWRVRAENFAGWGPFAVRQFRTYEVEVPQSFVLDQNYPNPFNGSTIIRFGVPHETTASVTLYDAIGRRVRILFSGTVKEGYHEVTMDAKHFASGVYWYEMVSDGYRDRKKLLLVR